MYKYFLHKSVQKFLAKQEEKFVRKVYEQIKILCQDPYTQVLDIKQLHAFILSPMT